MGNPIYSNEALNALVKLSQQGSRVAFDELTRYFWPKIMKYISHRVALVEDAKDLTQDVFTKAFVSIGTFRHDAAFSTWLRTISDNCLKDFYRQQKQRMELFVDYDDDLYKVSVDAGPSIESIVYFESLIEYFERKIASLPRSYRECLYLREIKGLSYQDIAAILDCPIGTVRSRIHRSKSLLDQEFLRFS